MVDYHAATGGQVHHVRERRFDLRFDLVTSEQRYWVAVVFEFAQVMRHDLLNELLRFFIRLFVIDEDLTDIVAQVIA